MTSLIQKTFAGKLYLLTVVLLITQTFTVFGQWQQVPGYFGEPVYHLRATSTKIFAVTLNGVVASADDGSTWANVPELYLTNVVEKMSTSGNTIIAYANPENYISTDDGASWSELNPPPGNPTSSTVIVESGIIYFGTYGDYLYTSDDGGLNWTQTTQGLTSSSIYTITADGNKVFVSTDDGIYKSTDFGASFNYSGLAGEYVSTLYTKSPYVFSFSTAGISQSTDDGLTWLPFEPTIPYSDVKDFLLDGNKVYAATGGELIYSIVFAPNWQAVNYSQDVAYNNSICQKGGSLFSGSNRGVFKSVNSGLNWTSSNNGIIPVNTVSLTLLNNDTLFAGSSIYGVSNFINSNWNYSGLALLNSNDLVTYGNKVFAASEFGIHESTDSGLNWSIISNVGPNPIISFCADIAIKDTLIIGAALQNGILRSGDFGISWSLENTGIAPSLVSSVGIIGTNLVAGTYDNGLFVSTDGGFNWTQSGASGELINDITVIGNNIIAASSGPNGNYISVDNGLTWNPVFSDYFDALSTSGIYVIASAPGYVALSMDSGFTYVNLTPAPAGTLIASSVASTNDVYVGTYYDGVWKISISEINALEQPVDNAMQPKIHPSIFNSATWLYIDEKLAQTNPTLQISDITGKLVYSAAITESKTFLTPENLSAGIYIYKVISSKFETGAGKIVKQ